MADSNLPILPDSLSGLPEPVTRNAWKALTHFLGGGASYLGEWIRRPTQSVADVTDGRQIVSAMLAEEVGRRAIADPQIVAAAAEKLLPGYARKLGSRFAVAEQTILELTSYAVETEQEKLSAPTEEVDPDWLNNFERFAEDATSEKMRNLWGRVLAGEIRRPGSFCKATLRALYELDSDVAQAFEAVRSHIIEDQVLSLDNIFTGISERAIPMGHLLTLESAGIIAGADGMIGWFFDINDHGHGVIGDGGHALAIFGPAGTRVQITSYPLSKVGRDLAALLPNNDPLKKLEQLGRYFENDTDHPTLTGAVIGPAVRGNDGKAAIDLETGRALWRRT